MPSEATTEAAVTERKWRFEPNDRFLFWAIFLLCVAVYGNSLWNGFAYDDDVAINQNPLIESLSNLPRIFKTGFWQQWTGQSSGRYRPLFFVSLSFEYALWGYRPAGYHLTNVLLHAANAGMFFVLARRYGLDRMLAGLAAVLFAVHPVHTEAVANIIGRQELMGTFFCGLAWLAWTGPVTGRRRMLNQALAGLAFLGALLTKENFVVFPAILLLAEGLASPEKSTAVGWMRKLVPYCIFAVSLAVYFGMRRLSGETLAAPDASIVPLAQISVWGRICTMASASVEWFRLMVFGYPLKPIYDGYNVEILKGPSPRAWFGAILTVSLVAWGVFSLKSRPVVTFGVGVWYVFLSIVSNIFFPISVVIAERWLYFPSVGYCLLVSFGLCWMFREFRSGAKQFSGQTIAAGIALSMVVGYSGLTIQRNSDWKSTLALFLRMTETDPDHPVAFSEVGSMLFEASSPNARLYVERALQLNPTALRPNLLLTRILLKEGQLAEARKRTDVMLASKPKAIVGRSPEWAEVHLLNAEILLREKRRDELKRELETVLYNAPGIISLRSRVGEIQLEAGDLADAGMTFGDICRDFPNLPEPHSNYGVVLAQLGRNAEARREFETALRLKPGLESGRRNLAELDRQEGIKKTP